MHEFQEFMNSFQGILLKLESGSVVSVLFLMGYEWALSKLVRN